MSGYIRLDDTTTFLALGDWVLAHGRSTDGLAPSTYEAMLSSYLAGGYPTGSVLPLAAAGRLTGVDLIWLWAPYLAVLGGLLAVAIAVLLRPLAPRAALRAGAAVLASCSALLLGLRPVGRGQGDLDRGDGRARGGARAVDARPARGPGPREGAAIAPADGGRLPPASCPR